MLGEIYRERVLVPLLYVSKERSIPMRRHCGMCDVTTRRRRSLVRLRLYSIRHYRDSTNLLASKFYDLHKYKNVVIQLCRMKRRNFIFVSLNKLI